MIKGCISDGSASTTASSTVSVKILHVQLLCVTAIFYLLQYKTGTLQTRSAGKHCMM